MNAVILPHLLIVSLSFFSASFDLDLTEKAVVLACLLAVFHFLPASFDADLIETAVILPYLLILSLSPSASFDPDLTEKIREGCGSSRPPGTIHTSQPVSIQI